VDRRADFFVEQEVQPDVGILTRSGDERQKIARAQMNG
jgi:hypothetical protein